VLPDVVQDRHAAVGRQAADGIEQRIIGAAAGGQLDADHAGVEAAADLGERLIGVVGIDGDVPADPRRLLPLEGEQGVVGVAQIGNGRKIRWRGQPPAPEDGGDVDGDAHALPRAQTAGVPGLPVRAGGAVVQEVGVHVDEHPRLPLLPIVRLLFLSLFLVRRGRAAECDFIGAAEMKFQIGLPPGLFLDGAIFIVDVVLVVDGWFSRRHRPSVVRDVVRVPARAEGPGRLGI
jgi:hypothetical protein